MSRFFKKSQKRAPSMSERPLPTPNQQGIRGPAANVPVGTYDTVPNETQNRTRRSNFMEKPEEGWHHDDRAMGAGLGVYFTYPVIYVGKILLPQSISVMQHDDQTDITREAIARCIDDSLPRNPKKRHLSPSCQRYKFGYVADMMFDVKLSMSARGIIIAPLDDPDGIVGFYPMQNISLATGGENMDYDYVSFTARDQDTGERHSHVFDCGLHSDDVMTDLGQAFALAQELARKQANASKGPKSNVGRGYLDVVPDGMDQALAPPPGAESLYAELEAIRPVANPMYGMQDESDSRYDLGKNPTYDSATGQSYFDVAPNEMYDEATFDKGYTDVAPNPVPVFTEQQSDMYFEVEEADPNVDPIAQKMTEVLSNPNALYDTATSNPAKQFVDVLNKHDEHAKIDGEDQYMLAQWTAYDTAQVRNTVDVSEYKGKSKLKDIYGSNNSPLYDTAQQNSTALYDTAGRQ